MTFRPRETIASSTRACPSSPPEIRRSTLESPLSLTSTTPRTQARRGLVEDEEFRFVEQRLGDGEPLLHPLGELLDPVIRPLGQLDLLQDGLAPSLDLVRRHSAEAPHIGESLERREVSVELRRLNHRTDAREGTGRLPAHLDAEEDGAAPRRSDQVC